MYVLVQWKCFKSFEWILLTHDLEVTGLGTGSGLYCTTRINLSPVWQIWNISHSLLLFYTKFIWVYCTTKAKIWALVDCLGMTIFLSTFTSKSKQRPFLSSPVFFLIWSHASSHSAVRQKRKTQIWETGKGENLIGVQAAISYLKIDVYAYANFSLFSCIYCMSYEITSEAVF